MAIVFCSDCSKKVFLTNESKCPSCGKQLCEGPDQKEVSANSTQNNRNTPKQQIYKQSVDIFNGVTAISMVFGVIASVATIGSIGMIFIFLLDFLSKKVVNPYLYTALTTFAVSLSVAIMLFVIAWKSHHKRGDSAHKFYDDQFAKYKDYKYHLGVIQNRSENSILSISESNQPISIINFFEDLLSFKVNHAVINKEDISLIEIKIRPNNRFKFEKVENASSSKYTMAGAMVGGVVGIVTGSLIDTILDSGKQNSVAVEYILEYTFVAKNGDKVTFCPYNVAGNQSAETKDDRQRIREYDKEFSKNCKEYTQIITSLITTNTKMV